MDDPVLIGFIGITLAFVLVVFVGGSKVHKSSKWRKVASGSLWALNAMLSGGASSPEEKGRSAYVRKRDGEDDDNDLQRG